MKIEFRNITQAAANLRAEMFVDGIMVVPQINMTPQEFNTLYNIMSYGIRGNLVDTISRDDEAY